MKYDLDVKHAHAICFGPFRYLAAHIRSGTNEKVFLSNFGTFQVKEARLKHLEENRKKRNGNNETTDRG